MNSNVFKFNEHSVEVEESLSKVFGSDIEVIVVFNILEVESIRKAQLCWCEARALSEMDISI